MEIEREHLELECERLELERRHTTMEEKWTTDMDHISMVMRCQFVEGSSSGMTQREIAVAEQEEEKGVDGDNKDRMADAEGEED